MTGIDIENLRAWNKKLEELVMALEGFIQDGWEIWRNDDPERNGTAPEWALYTGPSEDVPLAMYDSFHDAIDAAVKMRLRKEGSA